MRPFLARKAGRCGAVISALASSAPEASSTTAALAVIGSGCRPPAVFPAGVEPDVIADDYELSTDALRPLFTAMEPEDQGGLGWQLSSRNTTRRLETLCTPRPEDSEIKHQANSE
jgi:hypothetical protein